MNGMDLRRLRPFRNFGGVLSSVLQFQIPMTTCGITVFFPELAKEGSFPNLARPDKQYHREKAGIFKKDVFQCSFDKHLTNAFG